MATIILHPAMKPQREFFNPPTISIRSPDGEGEIVIAISDVTVGELAKAQRRVPLFQMWTHLIGEMPPINNAMHYPQTQYPNAKLLALPDAHACFKGVKRPLNQEDNGDDVYIYVISTPQTVVWKSDMACMVAIVDSPPNTLFTVHVRPVAALQYDMPGVWGAATKWEFVNADAERPTLPEAFNSRYSETLWEREG